MEMPVNDLQQALAELFVRLGGHGSKLWVLCGAGATVLIVAAALVPFLPARTRDRLRSRPIMHWLLSDWAFVLVALGSLVVLRLPGLSQLGLNPDEGGLILGARTLLHDPRFWISFENTTLGPLSTFSLVPIGVLGLPIDYTTIRIIGVVIWGGVITCVFLGMRRLYPGMWARLLATPLIVAIVGMSFWDYLAFNGEHMAVLMLAVAFLLHAPLLRDPGLVRPGRAFLLGAALALVPLAKIQPGPIAFAWGLVACAQAWFTCKARLPWLIAGAATPVVILGAYLFASGAWPHFVESYVLNNLLYASDGWNATQQDMTLWRNALGAPFYFLGVPDTRGFFLFVFLATGLFLVFAVFSARMRARMTSQDVVLGVVLVGAAAWCVLMPKNNWTHYLLLLCVPMGMLGAASVAALLEQARERRMDLHVELRAPDRTWTVRGNVFIAVMVAICGALGPACYAMMRGHPANQAAGKNLTEGRTPDAVTAALLRYVEPGEPVAHWGVRFDPLTHSGVSLGTRDAHIERALYPSRQQQYYLDRFVEDVRERRPRVLLDSNDLEVFHRFRLPNFPEQWTVVSELYVRVEDVAGMSIWLRRDVAAERGVSGDGE